MNDGAWTTAAAGATLTFASSWGAGAAKLRLNSIGTGDPGVVTALGLVIDVGIQSRLAQLRALAWG